MRVLLISANLGGGGPGGVVKDLYNILINTGNEACIAYARGAVPKDIKSIKIGRKIDVYTHVIKARLYDNAGFGSTLATKKLIEKIEEYSPDIINIHNILGYSINIEVLFSYLKETNIPVVWTLHDCWSFTGHCINFERINCEKWKRHCNKCELRHEYPKSIFYDGSYRNYERKKSLINEFDNLFLVTPSKWLRDLVLKSFLQDKSTRIINNGIDLDTFKTTPSNIRRNYNLQNSIIILAVASRWNEMKGQAYLFELSKRIKPPYKIVMIGQIEDRYKKYDNILFIDKTSNPQELAKWYTTADVFINPTMGDNFPTVNIEALACGLPIVTFNTGGSPEIIGENCGEIVPAGNIQILESKIYEVSSNKISRSLCVQRANEFDRSKKYIEYIKYFEELINDIKFVSGVARK